MLVRFMRLAPRFEMDLLDLATTAPNDRVRATAVAALGVCITDTARRVVRASLNAPDQRVRSNAIEAVDAGDPVLLEYKEDGSHRVRASAVRRLLATDNADQPGASARDAAAESLARMLTDDRPEHRLSGAWAAERTLLPERRDTIGLGWRAAARRVIDAADQDPDPRVRLRASRCARRMQAVPAGMAS
jgi:HEAT repeat protein